MSGAEPQYQIGGDPQGKNPSKWVYRGVWGVLTSLFKVPQHPPVLPALSGEEIRAFKPSVRFLSYLKLQFWMGAAILIILEIVGTIAAFFAEPVGGVVALVLAVVLQGLITAFAYLTIHLRYDTTWYVMSDRSLRLRRGIWLIRETTITFENVQNVGVRQGPLQRLFGIANVLVETAGGGGVAAQAGGQGQMGMQHRGLIEGVAEAHQIRDSLLARLRRSRTAGLGDEEHPDEEGEPLIEPAAVWTHEHLALLREIRDAAKALKA